MKLSSPAPIFESDIAAKKKIWEQNGLDRRFLCVRNMLHVHRLITIHLNKTVSSDTKQANFVLKSRLADAVKWSREHLLQRKICERKKMFRYFKYIWASRGGSSLYERIIIIIVSAIKNGEIVPTISHTEKRTSVRKQHGGHRPVVATFVLLPQKPQLDS